MADKSMIKLVSGCMNGTVGPDVALSGAATLTEQYPYFIPARYIKAAEEHRQREYSAEMLGGAWPYIGNWLLFLEHINGVKAATIQAPVKAAEPVVVAEQITPQLQQEMAGKADEAPIELADAEALPADIMGTEPMPYVAAEKAAADTKPIEMKPIEEDLFAPAQSDDYFLQQGIKVSADLPADIEELNRLVKEDDGTDKSLMVMMSFTEWLVHFKRTADKKNEEIEDQKAIRTMWQKEKLAAALEEENDEIPENVFEMAVNSISREEGLASESLAEIYVKQGKYDQAIEMYKKLSLRNPQKNAYFARKIEEITKEK